MRERASVSMSKRALWGMVVLCAALTVLTLYNYQQRLLCWWLNRKIQVAGVRLMMPVTEVEALLGEERENHPGFGGYMLVYPNRGIALTLLSDGGTDFYHKVSEIKVTDPSHAVFGVRVGDSAETARRAFQDYGFSEEREGHTGLWKLNSFVTYEVGGSGAVTAISVGIKDRVAQSRVY
ncbi:MAG: hypothetical protein ACM3WU_04160 [Bacillota bacterium]